LRKRFAVPDGGVRYLAFDHEIRMYRDRRGKASFVKRNYTMSLKLFDPTLTRIEAYYADAMQPRRLYERGKNAGIVDLQHIYPEGRTIARDRRGNVRVRVFAGASDAHTALYEVDVMGLLREMSPGSARWRKGQVYRPQP